MKEKDLFELYSLSNKFKINKWILNHLLTIFGGIYNEKKLYNNINSYFSHI